MERIKHYWNSIGFAWKVILGVYTAVAALDTVQAQFFPVKWQQQVPRAYDIYMLAPWYIWAIGLLVLIAISAIESSYRKADVATAALDVPKPINSQQKDDSSLKISVGEDGRYVEKEYRPTSLGTRYRTFYLMIENKDKSHRSARDCMVKIESISPASSERDTPFTLNDPIVFSAGGFAFVPLVSYGEKGDGVTGYAKSFAEIETSEGRKPSLEIDKEHVIKLVATAQDMAPSYFFCKVWVDQSGKLRIVEIDEDTYGQHNQLPSTPLRELTEEEGFEIGFNAREEPISLAEGCRIAYENTRASLQAAMAEKQAEKGGDQALLNWYATWLTAHLHVPLYGARSPSTKQD